MNLGHALFSLDGRINRKTFWISMLLLLAVSGIIGSIVGSIFMPPADPSGTFEDMKNQISELQDKLKYYSLIIPVIFTFPFLAVGGKRFHDRNKSMLWFVPYIAAMFIDPILVLTGNAGTMFEPSTARLVGYAIGGAIFIWIIIELGALRGTEGSNQYGEDTLPPRQQTA